MGEITTAGHTTADDHGARGASLNGKVSEASRVSLAEQLTPYITGFTCISTEEIKSGCQLRTAARESLSKCLSTIAPKELEWLHVQVTQASRMSILFAKYHLAICAFEQLSY